MLLCTVCKTWQSSDPHCNITAVIATICSRDRFFQSKRKIFLLWFSQITVVKVVVCLLSSQSEEMLLLFVSCEECTGIAESLVAAALGNAAWYVGSTVTFVPSARLSEGNLTAAGVGSSKEGQEHCKVLEAQGWPSFPYANIKVHQCGSICVKASLTRIWGC